jgi:hypothetical protein
MVDFQWTCRPPTDGDDDDKDSMMIASDKEWIRLNRDDDRTCEFIVSGPRANSQLANAIRRTILASVPTLAIDIIHFRGSNDAVLNHQFVAQRLSCLPIRVESFERVDQMSFHNECRCRATHEQECKSWEDENQRMDERENQEAKAAAQDNNSKQVGNKKKRRDPEGDDDDELDEGPMQGCRACSIVGMIDVVNDRADGQVRVVTDHDLTWFEPNVSIAHATIDGQYPIVELAPGQRFSCSVIARKGIEGANVSLKHMHSKWSPTIAATYVMEHGNRYRFNVETTGVWTARQVVQASLELLRRDVQHVIQSLSSSTCTTPST